MDFNNLENYIIDYGTKAIGAILVLIIGFKVANVLVKLIEKALDKKGVDQSLKPFLGGIISWSIKICVILAAASTAGIKTTSFLAILGSAGLAVGLALQGSLSNFAGGVMILLLKPFKVGDFIDTGSHSGTVYQISVFATILKTPDNKTIVIPNGGLANSAITNFNHEPTRRVDFLFGIGYSDDIDFAKSTIKDIVEADSRLLKDKELTIVVSELGDSSVNITVRAWVKSSDYWGMFFDTTEKVKKTFDAKNISIPFPQRDVHLHEVKA